MKLLLSNKFVSLFISVFVIHIGLYAQETKTLREVVIVSRPLIEEIKIDSFATVSAVVTQAQLRDLNAVDLASALRRTPGVQISRYNPVGSFGGDQGGAVFIRGMGLSRPGSEIKMYIDGMPFYMGLWNHPLLDLLPINGMQHISVHKSAQPQSSGNNFASVNLQTFNPATDSVKLQANARISAGSFGTFIEQANLYGRAGKVDYGIAQGFARSDGHRSNADGALRNVIAKLGTDFSPNWRAELSFLYVNNRASDPGDARTPAPAVAPEYNTEAGMLSIGVLHNYKNVKGSLRLYANRGTGSWMDQPAPDGNTISNFETQGIRWTEQFQPWAGGALTFNLDFDRWGGSVDFERIDPAPADKYEADAFTLISPNIGLSHTFILGSVNIRPSAGIRYYSHSEFNSATAPYAGINFQISNLAIYGNYAKGINFPGLEAPLLAHLIPPLADSWPKLKPEELNHFEVGTKWSPLPSTQIDVSFFNDKVKNRYIFGFPPALPPPPQFINLGGYTITGWEVSVRQDIANSWQVFAGLTLLNPDIENLPYTPETAITTGLNGKIGRVGIVFDAQYQSETKALNRTRVAGDENLEAVDAFTVVNTRISYQLPVLGKQGEVFATVDNLFDETYAYRPGYVMPGRWFQVGVSASLFKTR